MTEGTRSMPGTRQGLIVALDGPASSGKSTVGSRAAAALGYRFVDTGLLYRGVTWLAQQLRVPPDAGDLVADLVPRVSLRAGPDGRFESVVVDGVDVTHEVHAPTVDRWVSDVARQPEVRAALLVRQRELARGGDILVAGRDIGTVVLPDADLKIFLEASPEERARRRAEQRGYAPDSLEAAAILGDLRRRDEIDRNRNSAPLRAADDAVRIVTDGNEIEDTVAAVTAVIAEAEATRAAIRAGKASRAAQLAAAERTAVDLAATEAAVPPAVAEAGAGVEPRDGATQEVPADAGAAAPDTTPRRPGRERGTTSSGEREAPIPDHLTPFIRFSDWFGRTVTSSLTRVHIEGLDQPLRIEGPLIVASNHASNADGVLLACWLTPALGRRIHWLGKQEALDWPLVGWAIAQNGVFGVRRGAADLEAFRAAKRVLDEGHVLGVFPEGTRSNDGRLQEAKEGAAILALRTGAPILPVGISGTHRFWPRGQKLFRPGGHVRMRVGEVFTLPTPAPKDRRRAQGEAIRTIMTKIAELLPPSQRGMYADDVARAGER